MVCIFLLQMQCTMLLDGKDYLFLQGLDVLVSVQTNMKREALRNLCIFFATVYVKIWTLAHVAVKAPNEDLKLLKTLQ